MQHYEETQALMDRARADRLLGDAVPGSMEERLVQKLALENSISIIAVTATSTSLHPNLLRAGFFDRCVPVPALSAATRSQAIRALAAHAGVGFHVGHYESRGVDFRELAVRTDGYCFSDLSTLIERVVHAISCREHEQKRREAKYFRSTGQILTSGAHPSQARVPGSPKPPPVGEYLTGSNQFDVAAALVAASKYEVQTQGNPQARFALETDLDAAFHGFVPSALRGIQVRAALFCGAVARLILTHVFGAA